MNLFTMNKATIKICYKHVWIDHPLTIAFVNNHKPVGIDISGKNDAEFSKTIDVTNENQFEIAVSNKTTKNTNKIGDDSYVVLKSFKIDNFEMINLFHKKSQFHYFETDTKQILEATTVFGHNGKFYLKFSFPVHHWLLEALF